MKTEFASVLSSLRRASGRSQKKAADDLGISQALLSHYENGIREPKLEFVLKVCNYYGVTADYILGRTTEKNTKGRLVPETATREEQRCWDAAMLISAILSDIDDDSLRRVASSYVCYSLYVVLSALRWPIKPYEPLFDAAAKAAEARLFGAARRAQEKADITPKLSDEALKERYPELHKTLLEIDEIIGSAVVGLSGLGRAGR